MSTVKNNEPKRIGLTQADLDKIAAACCAGRRDFDAPKRARFT